MVTHKGSTLSAPLSGTKMNVKGTASDSKTMVEVNALIDPDMLIETEAIAQITTATADSP